MIDRISYGKDYANDVFDFEIEAAGTQFQATDASRTAFETLWDGNVWMIFRNTVTNVLHWDFVRLFIAKFHSWAYDLIQRPRAYHRYSRSRQPSH